MFIVDAQVHIWGANTPERPWPSGRTQPHRPQPFSKDDLLKEIDAAGVARVVIVPPSWEGDRNDLALQAARLHPDRFAVMGRPPAAARFAQRLARSAGHARAQGLVEHSRGAGTVRRSRGLGME